MDLAFRQTFARNIFRLFHQFLEGLRAFGFGLQRPFGLFCQIRLARVVFGLLCQCWHRRFIAYITDARCFQEHNRGWQRLFKKQIVDQIGCRQSNTESAGLFHPFRRRNDFFRQSTFQSFTADHDLIAVQFCQIGQIVRLFVQSDQFADIITVQELAFGQPFDVFRQQGFVCGQTVHSRFADFAFLFLVAQNTLVDADIVSRCLPVTFGPFAEDFALPRRFLPNQDFFNLFLVFIQSETVWKHPLTDAGTLSEQLLLQLLLGVHDLSTG